MQKKYINLGLPIKLAEHVQEAVKKGRANTTTDLINKAVTRYLDETRESTITDGIALQDNEGRISAFGMRMTLFPLLLMGLIKKEIIEVSGEDNFEKIISKASKQAGMDLGMRIERTIGESGDVSFSMIADLARPFGWARAEVEETKNGFTFKAYHTWESEAYIETYGQKSDHPVCNVMGAFCAGIAFATIRKNFNYKETKCLAKGDPFCQYEFETTD